MCHLPLVLTASSVDSAVLLARIAELEAREAALRGEHQAREAALRAERDTARAALQQSETARQKAYKAYLLTLEQLELLRRKLFMRKAERTTAPTAQLAFDGLLDQTSKLEKDLAEAERLLAQCGGTGQDGEGQDPGADTGDGKAGGKGQGKTGHKPSGRRDLAETDLPVIRVELTDPELEGKVERIGFEESSRLGYERGGYRRIVLARAIYKQPVAVEAVGAASVGATGGAADTAAAATAELVTTPLPREVFRRGLLAPSMVAHLLVSKYVLGTPFYRMEDKLRFEGVRLDRGTMCRYAEEAGATLGAVVLAMRDEAMQACCLSTDATGVAIQPGPLPKDKGDGSRPCHKGHFFIVLADRDHVFFEYQRKHTSSAVADMFKGFSGYLQADAHAVYGALFRRAPDPTDPEDTGPPTEVGCWAHARRKFWEAAVSKHAVGTEGLRRINAIFEADRPLGKLPPERRKALRLTQVRPLVEAFFAWVTAQLPEHPERGLVRTALGYAFRQQAPLRRFLEDGRLKLDNNGAERGLRPISVGRKAWLFCGSDDHASAAANLFSLVASCKLHDLDPEAYFAEVLRVLPYWPKDRFLELTPKYWAATRGRLDLSELLQPLGHITVPPAILPATEEQPVS